jgi:hypothetical protein
MVRVPCRGGVVVLGPRVKDPPKPIVEELEEPDSE